LIQIIKTNWETYRFFLKNLSINILFRFGHIAINLITGLIISRTLLEANRGIYGLFITSLYLFNVALNLGFNASALYYSQKNPEKLNSFLSSNLVLSLISSLLVWIAIIMFSQHFPFQDVRIVYLFSITYFTYSISLIFRSFLAGKDFLLFSNKVDFVLRFFFLVYVVVLYLLKELTVFNVLLYLFFEYLMYGIIAFKKLNFKIWPLSFDFVFLKSLFFFNAKAYLYMFFIALLVRSDQYIIKKMLGNFHVGIYSMCASITEQMGIISALIATMYLPRFLEEKRFDVLLKKTNKILLLVLGLSILIALGVYIATPMIIQMYFKNQNPVSIETLRLLLIAFVFWSLFMIVSTLSLAIRIKKTNIIAVFIALTINVIVNLIYIPIYGIKAAAISSAIAYAILFFIMYIDLFYLKKKNYLKKQNGDFTDLEVQTLE
jgi:O-antigen/teichoic acid export membrane protein